MYPIVDANVILRYLLRDVPDQAESARGPIDRGCETTTDIVADIVYVPSAVYSVPRKKIFDVLTELLDIIYAEDFPTVVEALRLFGREKLDFADCLLLARNRIEGHEIITFDKKLVRLLNKRKTTDAYRLNAG